jgi:putative ABC transport system permease protein
MAFPNHILSIFKITLKRIWAQRNLALATELGLIAAVALLMVIPIYSDAVYYRILQTELGSISESQDHPPFAYLYQYIGSWSGSVQWEQVEALDTYLTSEGVQTLGLPVQSVVSHFETDLYSIFPSGLTSYGDIANLLGFFSFATTGGIQDNILILDGHYPLSIDPSTNDPIEVLVFLDAAEELGLQVGDTFTAYNHREDNATLQEIPLIVAGIWRASDETSDYWFISPRSYQDLLLVNLDTYLLRLSPYMDDEVHQAIWYFAMDGSHVDTGDVNNLISRASQVSRRVDTLLPGTLNTISPMEALQKYSQSTSRLTILLLAFGIPVIGLILIFIILMVGLTVEQRRNELAIMRSRGATRIQIIGFSALEGVVLGTIALVLGAALAFLLAYFLGKTRGFLDFSAPAALRVHITNAGWHAGLLAVGLAIMAQIIPTISISGNTIVGHKQDQARETKKPLWQRIWLDVLLFIPVAYGFYTLRHQGTVIALNNPASSSDPFQDPLLFLLPALAAFSWTLFFVRLFPWLMTAVSRLLVHTDNVSILLASRQLGRAPRFYVMPLMLLVLTVNLTVFTASLALTLDYHLYDTSLYQIGADVSLIGPGIFEEQTSVFAPPVEPGEIQEDLPDSVMVLPMSEYLDFPGVQAATRVGRYTALAKVGGINISGVLLGVDRSEFTRVAFWRSDFASSHLGDLMNKLAFSPDAILVSRGFARENGLDVGDFFRLDVNLGEARLELFTQIVGLFDYFPTWYPQETGPLFVGNLENLFTQAGGEFPYEVWLYTKSWPDLDALDGALGERQLYSWHFREPYTYIASEQSRPERQGMFGLLSIGYSAAALLTVLGFFAYALFSFRRRMVALGVLRAVGMSTRQMGVFVGFELAFLILSGLTLGTVMGVSINQLFIPYLQIGDTATSITPPYLIEMAWPAVFQIYILFAVLFVVALLILVILLRRMKVFEAIKLGETV